jgi:hypothetical protein
MMRTKGFACVVVCVLALLWAAPAFAQEQTGGLTGVVKDASGAVLPGVTVEVRSPSVIGANTAVTDAQGVYRFPALPPGKYTVTATLQGFTPYKAEADIALGQLLKIDLALAVGGVTETVQVSGESPLIDVKQNAAFANIQSDMIQRLPKGRDFTEVIKVAPGAQDESRAGGFQIDGSSGSENRFIIDGMDTTDLRTGVSGKTMLVDFIQEVQVKSSGYNAEFGGALGGVINAITKSGSNKMRGGAGIYYDSDRMYGARRPSNRYWPWDQYKVERGVFSPDTPYTYLSPVVDIGGPILKDKIWFYAGMAYTSNQYNRDVKFYDDPARKTYHFDWGSWAVYPNYNVTTQINSNLRVKFTGSQQRNSSRKTAPGLQPDNSTMSNGEKSAGLTTGVFETDATLYDQRWNQSGLDSINYTWSGNVDWVLKPTLFVNATAGFFRTNSWTPPEYRGNEIRHTFGSANSDATMTTAGYPLVPAAYQHVSGWSDVARSSSGTLRDIKDRIFFNANTIWYKSLAGQHIVKAGVRFERFTNDVYYGYTKPNISLNWGQTYQADDGRVLTGKYGYITVNKTGTIGTASSNNWSIWLQDSWTIANRLTINAGVRAENEKIPTYKHTADAIEMQWGLRDKIAPRIGFAYDLKGDGRWKAYGSYGLFYDITKLELPIGQWGGDHWINYYWSLDTYDWTTINCDEGTTGCPGTFFEQWDARRSTNQVDPVLEAYFNRPGMTGVDPNLMPVRTGEFMLGLDRELNRTMSLGVRYIHKWMDRTIEDIGINFPGIGEVYVHGNPGFGITEVMVPSYPQYKTPKATRQYNAIEFRLRKRFANRWSGEANYTYSKLWGNYSGLASSDEGGRTSPNVNRYFDNLYMSYDNKQQQVFGLLHTDRPHVLKLNATYDLPWGTSVGVYQILETGLVESQEMSYVGYPVFPYGRGVMTDPTTLQQVGNQRSPAWYQTDLAISHDFKLGGNRRVSLSANITNLFDQMIRIRYYSYQLWRNNFSFTNSDLMYFGAPWEPAQLVALKRAGTDPSRTPPTTSKALIRDELLYMVPNSYQGRRDIRLQVKFSF